MTLADVIAQLHRVEITDHAIDRCSDIFIAECCCIGLHLVAALNRLRHIKVTIAGGDSTLLIQKDVSLGVEKVFARFCLAGIEARRLLHVIEHDDRVTSLHALPLGGQDLHHTAIGFWPQGYIRRGTQLTHHIDRRIELRFSDGGHLHREHLGSRWLAATSCQQQEWQRKSE